MSEYAIRVEHLSKRYRIGQRQERPQTLAQALAGLVRAPLDNYRRLRAMRHFSANGHDEPDVIWALRDVSFDVRHGEVVGIIGRNGAGKSTLLKILSRITEPTSGRAVLNGRVASLLEVGTGFHPDLTGRENVYLNGTLLGMKRREVDRRFDEIVAFAGVEQFVDTAARFYSSGMRVRLAFAVAAHLEAEILFVDEVLAVGDFEFQQKCLGKMQDVAESGRTVLFVSHSMGAIEALCRRAIVLDKGKLVDDDIASEACRRYIDSFGKNGTGARSLGRSKGGNGRLRILDVHVTTGDSTVPVHHIHSGDPFSIRILVFASEPVIEPTFSLALRVSAGSRVFLVNSDDYGTRIERIEGYKIVELTIDGLLLAPGGYICNIMVSEKSGAKLEHLVDIPLFDVMASARLPANRKYDQTSGVIYVHPKWRIQSVDESAMSLSTSNGVEGRCRS